MDLTDYLINGVAENGTTAVLDADTVGSTRRILGGTRRAVGHPAALLTSLPPGDPRRERSSRMSSRNRRRRSRLRRPPERRRPDHRRRGQDGAVARAPRPPGRRRTPAAASRVLAVVAILDARGARRLEADGIRHHRVRSARSATRSPRCRAPRTCCSSPAGSSARSTAPTSRGRRTRSFRRAWRSISRSRAWSCSRPATSIRSCRPAVPDPTRTIRRRPWASTRNRASDASASSSSCRASGNLRALIFRLNYAVDLRYGTLVDIARKVFAGEPIDLTMGFFNAIWQGDANSYALRSLELCSSPPAVLNVTGPERISVRETAEWFGVDLRPPAAVREHRRTRGAPQRFEPLPRTARRTRRCRCALLRQWVAHWVRAGGASLEQADALRSDRWPLLTPAISRRCAASCCAAW